MNPQRPWTVFALECEAEMFGMFRIAKWHNELMEELAQTQMVHQRYMDDLEAILKHVRKRRASGEPLESDSRAIERLVRELAAARDEVETVKEESSERLVMLKQAIDDLTALRTEREALSAEVEVAREVGFRVGFQRGCTERDVFVEDAAWADYRRSRQAVR